MVSVRQLIELMENRALLERELSWEELIKLFEEWIKKG